MKNNNVGDYLEVVITSLNIICVSKGKFRKPNIIQKYPLSKISLINGEPQIQIIKDFSEKSNIFTKISEIDSSFTCDVVINFTDSSLTLSIVRSSKIEAIKDSSDIVDKIRELITGISSQTIISADKGNGFFAGIKNTVFGAMGAEPNYNVQTNAGSSERVTGKCVSCRAPLTGFKGATLKCNYCDTEQVL